MTTLTDALAARLNQDKAHDAAPVTLVERITYSDLVDAIMHEVYTVIGSDLLPASAHWDGASPMLKADLDAAKATIQEEFDSTLRTYQAHFVEVGKLNKQYIQVRDSKNPSAKRMDDIQEQIDAEMAAARVDERAFLTARHKEEVFRLIPTSYKDPATQYAPAEAWLTALHYMFVAEGLRAGGPAIHKNITNRFSR